MFGQPLKKMLAADGALAREIAESLASEAGEAAGDRLNVQTSGDQSSAIGKISDSGSATIGDNGAEGLLMADATPHPPKASPPGDRPLALAEIPGDTVNIRQ